MTKAELKKISGTSRDFQVSRGGIPKNLVATNATASQLNKLKIPYVKGKIGWHGTRNFLHPTIKSFIHKCDEEKVNTYLESKQK